MILPPSWSNLSRAEVAARIGALPPEKRTRLAKWAKRHRARRIWSPFPGPQSAAFVCDADVIGFGGAGGGGKTDLALGRAIKRHRRTSFYRRTYPTLGAAIDRSRDILRPLEQMKKARYSEQKKTWTLNAVDGYPRRRVRFAAMQYEKDKENERGNPDDLKVFDECQNFTESQVRFCLGWLRTNIPGQITTALLTFNPPTSIEGQWIIDFFAPWLDPRHPNPAKDGEIRWFAMVDGKETEVGSGDAFEHTPKLADGTPGRTEVIHPRSRTFFKARVEDNPVYMETGYRDMLAALPEPLRSQMLNGDFQIGMDDDNWQIFPTVWVQMAIARGRVTSRPIGDDGKPLKWSAIGGDIAAGGADLTTFARRVDDWYAPVLAYPGKETPDGRAAAKLLIDAMTGDGGSVPGLVPNIDVIGIGQGIKTALEMLGVAYAGINVGMESYGRAQASRLAFYNLKAEIYWRFREALDPESGRNVCLPDDRELLADLCAIRWEFKDNKIAIEKKEVTKKRVAVGLHKAEAVMLANYVPGVAAWGHLPGPELASPVGPTTGENSIWGR